MDRFLELYRLGKTYPTPQGPSVVVRDFDLIVHEGEFVSVIGHSGCGKSTVLSMVAGLTPPTVGSVVLAGREIAGPGPDRGVVFQSPSLLPWMTALQNVLLGVDRALAHCRPAERLDIASYWLELVGLGDVLHRRPPELSQGMRQRVGIARAFALSPKVLLLDEPFGMLDQLTRIELQDVLADLCRRDRRTAVMVTHDVDEAIFLSDRVVMMTAGPAATVGDVVTIDLPRPRCRAALLEDPAYYRHRERLIEFLEDHDAHSRPRPADAHVPAATAESDGTVHNRLADTETAAA